MTPADTALSTSRTAPAVITPTAPAHLPESAQQQWTGLYTRALAQAKANFPDNDRVQRSAALKAANAMLAVTPPTSAADIEDLEPWQVLHRGTRVVKGVTELMCVTSDGKRYSFPVRAAAPATNLQTMTKEQLVTHAAEKHGLDLDASAMKKDELIAAIQEKAAQ